MCAGWKTSILILSGMLLCAGCNQNRMQTAPPMNLWQQQPTSPYDVQIQDLGQRASDLDADNRDLHTELARSQQQTQLLKDELELVRERLTEAADQLRELQVAKQDAEKQIQAFHATATRNGGAILKANNSLQDGLQLIQIPGAEVRQDADVIRIELSADQLFQPGSSQVSPSAYNLLDQVADAISRAYPRQVIGIEGHSDSTPVGVASSHQLTAAQAVAVLDILTRRNRLPSGQLFSVGHGSNHPRASNATPAGRAKNRRIELVVYPEAVDPS